MKYRTLFLDLDNTLLDFSKAEDWAIEKTLIEFVLPFDKQTKKLYSEINATYWQRFERGEIPKNAIFEGRFKTLLSVLKEDRSITAISECYFKNLSATYFKMEDADEVLTYLKGKGYKLYATTNGYAATQHSRIAKSGLEPYFDKVFVSEDVGAQKPDKAYFDFCINDIGENDKSKILVVGDSESSDILGGINSSLDTCWLNPEGAAARYEPTYQIKNIKELKNLL
ncbi:MAG: YjjG family noncanonical pyrimidine nucleotidase [Clostridia bacterium]|nr:YjjG family noncanonical pyrimidine nucleotidase [Clostridia bacterium]